MNMIHWSPDKAIQAGTTLKDITRKEQNNMALHVGGHIPDILQNRKELSDMLTISSTQWVFANQTHSDHIYEVTKQDIGKGALNQEQAIFDCDALYTKEKNIAIGVFHADCVPILLFDPYTNIICAIHSGWLGTTKEITSKTIQHLMSKEGVDPAHIHAYIGPSIAFHSLEVGQDVIEKVKAMSFDTSSYIVYKDNEKAYLDNKGLNEQMLLDAGVKKHHIRINQNDTFLKNDSFFSYRRDHNCGRHLSFINRI